LKPTAFLLTLPSPAGEETNRWLRGFSLLSISLAEPVEANVLEDVFMMAINLCVV
jgi:hypothetical protein